MAPDKETFSSLQAYGKALAVVLGYRDLQTQLHSVRVEGLAEDIGLLCGLSGEEIVALRIAASFHDIGKIGIPDRILLKTTPFEEAELKQMRQHAVIGEKIIAAIEFEGAERTANVIRHHHEQYDGTGYPDRLAGEDIPICARIISIADSYDAMAVTRPYHRERTHAEIMGILEKETGKKHDPEVMRIFGKYIESSQFKAAQT